MNGLTQFEKVLGIDSEKQVNHRHQSINTHTHTHTHTLREREPE